MATTRGLPADMLAGGGAELAVDTTGSPDWLRRAASQTARAIPGASHMSFDGGYHDVPPEVLASTLTDFFTAAKKATALPVGLPSPVRRALAGAGLETLEDVARFDRTELACLHGVGPRALAVLDEALAWEGDE